MICPRDMYCHSRAMYPVKAGATKPALKMETYGLRKLLMFALVELALRASLRPRNANFNALLGPDFCRNVAFGASTTLRLCLPAIQLNE